VTEARQAAPAPGEIRWDPEAAETLAALRTGPRILRAAFEAALLVGGLQAAEIALLGAGGFAAMAIHPFWAAVLLVSLQHGLYGGLAAAGLAGLALHWAGFVVHGAGAASGALAAQWLASGLILGLLREPQIRREAALAADHGRLQRMNAALAREASRFDEIVRELEVALVTRPDARPPAAEAALLADLRRAVPAALPARFAEAMRTLLPQADAALYAETGEGGPSRLAATADGFPARCAPADLAPARSPAPGGRAILGRGPGSVGFVDLRWRAAPSDPERAAGVAALIAEAAVAALRDAAAAAAADAR